MHCFKSLTSFHFLFSDIPLGKAELQISPQVVAYVEENNSLTFTCTATALQFSLISWQKACERTTNTLVKGTCADFNSDINLAIYQFSCSGNLFNWTILQITKQQHGDEWFCRTNDLQGIESIKTRIFVKGNCFVFTTVADTCKYYWHKGRVIYCQGVWVQSQMMNKIVYDPSPNPVVNILTNTNSAPHKAGAVEGLYSVPNNPLHVI